MQTEKHCSGEQHPATHLMAENFSQSTVECLSSMGTGGITVGLESRLLERHPHRLWNSKQSQSNSHQFLQNFSYLTKVKGPLLSQRNWSSSIGSSLGSFRVSHIVSHKDTKSGVETFDWKPDSNMVAVSDFAGDIFVLRLDQSDDQTGILLDDFSLSSPLFPLERDLDHAGDVKWSKRRNSFYAARRNSVAEYTPEVLSKSVVLGTSGKRKCWWECLEESRDNRMIVAGDSRGSVVAMDSCSHEVLWKYQMHLSGVERLSFNPMEPWLLASVHHREAVKLWDVRMLRRLSSSNKLLKPVEELGKVSQDQFISNAAFNSRGDLLLTNDVVNDVIHVYKGPNWRDKITIDLPHTDYETFRYIKVCWHPLTDLFLIGQTPGLQDGPLPDETTINVFCGLTGRRVCQLFGPNATDLPANITQMNSCGTMIACTAGSQLLIWKPHFPQ